MPTCDPPAVDYTPLYFFINGLSFSKDARQASALPIPAAGSTGNVLLRFVNAGSHMHVPTVTGLNMLLVAEDGHILPDVALALAPPAPAVAKTLTAKTLATPLGLQLRNEIGNVRVAFSDRSIPGMLVEITLRFVKYHLR